MLNRIFVLFICLTLALCTLSCNSEIQNENTKLSIVATLYPQYDFAKQICGDKADVSLLLLPGTDSHSFELGASDAVSINKSDIFIYTGPNMEIWANSIIKAAPETLKVLNLSEYTVLLQNYHGKDDNHFWTSPIAAKDMLKAIFDAVCEADPDNADYYENNYKVYENKLEELNKSFLDLANATVNKTAFFCGSFPFLYLFEEYGFDYVAPFNSCSGTEIESLGDISKFLEEIKQSDIKFVFYEANEYDTIIDTITSETNTTALPLHSIHEVTASEYADNVGYIDLMYDNLDNLRKAFENGKAS